MKPALDIHELSPGEIDDLLDLRRSMFGATLPGSAWDIARNTAVLARERGGSLVGAIPFQFRDFQIGPMLSIRTAFAYGVGVAAGHRGRGIGTAIYSHAAECLADRVDALFVYRGIERSDAYRFYRKNGHGDLHYMQRLEIPRPRGAAGSVDVLPLGDAVEHEKDILALWRRCYSRCGGHRVRGPGYFEQALAAHIYRAGDWRILLLRDRGRIVAYATINAAKGRNGCLILDLAASNRAALQRVLTCAERFARKAGLALSIWCSAENPLWRGILKQGFELSRPAEPHDIMIMARILGADRIFRRLACSSPLLHSLKLTAITPHRDIVLNDPPRAKHAATIGLKESILGRLMTSRLDFASAVRMNLVRISPVPGPVEAELDRVFRFAPWIGVGADLI